MARFYLIDQSLFNDGGHHFDYSSCIVNAANELGFDTVVAANRSVSSKIDFANTTIVPAFKNTVYQRTSWLAGLRHLKRVKSEFDAEAATSGWRRATTLFRNQRLMRRRNRAINQFSRDCQSFFDNWPLADGDHVFYTTVSEIELLGLGNFLRTNPSTLLATWHLQFHFNVFDGRPPEYDSQKNTEQLVRSAFKAATAGIPSHRLHFYTSSEPLAGQYNRLNVGTFAPLPYPIAPEFSSNKSANAPMSTGDEDRPPLRFTCPGQIRREKGCGQYLQPLINDLWDSHLATGKIRIAVQRPRKKFLRRPKIELNSPEPQLASQASGADDNNSSPTGSPFEYHAHPLRRPDYINLLLDTDCGLLLYDNRAYYSRRAGVLGELLACGKPLIVPAGSWLADQISEPNFQYAEQLSRTVANDARTLEIDALEWNRDNAPSSGGVISFDKARHPFVFSLNRQPDEGLMKINFQWQWPKVQGTYCQFKVTQRNGTGQSIDCTEQIVGHRNSKSACNSLFRINGQTETIEVSMSNAYEGSTAMIKELQVQMLAVNQTGLGPKPSGNAFSRQSDRVVPTDSQPKVDKSAIKTARQFSLPCTSDAQSVPLGKVGIIVADLANVSEAVSEMVNHYEHYRATAEEFSGQWFAMHHPKRTIAHLIGANDAKS